MAPARSGPRVAVNWARRHWRIVVVLGVVLFTALAVWVRPRRTIRIVLGEERLQWIGKQIPLRRQFVWEPATELQGVLPTPLDRAQLVTPSFANTDSAIYFALRCGDGQADIYQTRLSQGRWQPAEPVTRLNTPADDIGPVLSSDGQSLYFYSNRAGGVGGFDLYVAHRGQDDWDTPQNLGPQVNSPAHEYDPALSADGLTLFFASNRTPDMARHSQERLARSAETAAERTDWSATLRAHPGLVQFDLYRVTRATRQEPWTSPRPLVDLNSPTANEGAPCPSATAPFLYFASDRPARDGESPNLDLYRARQQGTRFVDVENLGTSINTSAHETEPGLSPEGMTLVFSSNRGSTDTLYRSRAREVYQEIVWDTTRWTAFQAISLSLLLWTLLLVVVLVSLWCARRQLAEWIAALKFYACSVVFHIVTLLVLVLIPLHEVVLELVEEVRGEVATQLVDNNLHQSHEDGQEAYEKVADLQSVADVVLSETVRQTTEPAGMPTRTNTLAPTIPVEVARQMPPERLLFVPPQQQAVVRQPLPLARASLARPNAIAAIAPEAVELPPAMAIPQEQVLEKEVHLQRATSLAPETTSMELPRVEMVPAAYRPASIRVETPAPERPQVAEPPQADADAMTQHRRPAELPELGETVQEIQVNASADSEQESPPVPALAQIDRQAQSGPMPKKTLDFAGDAEAPRLGLTEAVVFDDLVKTMEPDPRPEMLGQQIARVTILPELRQAMLRAETGIDLQRQAAPNEELVEGIDVALPRPEPTVARLPAPTPTALAGPVRAPTLAVGTLAPAPREVTPSLHRIASRLARPPARAAPVAYAEDNIGLQAMFSLRQGEVRRQLIDLFGGSDETEDAVERGLAWLAKQQSSDGSWSLHKLGGSEVSDTAGTALGLLPFLGAGHTHQTGSYQETVRGALEWLVSNQAPSGLLLAKGSKQPMYSHGLATIALCEAYGMTRDAKLSLPVQKALAFIAKAQHARTGGWRYKPNESGDTSVVGWQVMALKSGEMAGLAVEKDVLAGVHRWLARVEDRRGRGRFGYQNNKATPAMTAEGLLCLQFLGTQRNDARLQSGADYLMGHLPQKGRLTSYYLYYATQVMYHMQGSHWQAWNEKMRDLLVGTQRTSGAHAGSWDPLDRWEKRGGRVYTTSLRLLMLEIYYRHLPLYQPMED